MSDDKKINLTSNARGWWMKDMKTLIHPSSDFTKLRTIITSTTGKEMFTVT